MANVYYTKKSKQKMRARKRKKEKSMVANGGSDGNDHDEPTENGINSNVQGSHSSRKRPADQISNDTHIEKDGAYDVHKKGKSNISSNHHQSTTTITIPADLTSKDGKKFRKDARRKARLNGQDENQLKFIIEGQKIEEESSSAKDTSDRDKEDETSHKHPTKKKQKREFPRINDLLSQAATQQKLAEKLNKQKSINDSLPPTEKQQYIAIDCEMVGIGSDGRKSSLARATVVNWDGDVLLDTFVQVHERVTDFRTHVSGVRAKNIKSTDAMDPETVRNTIGKLLMGKVLVGHALKNDLGVLMLSHPRIDIRDTAKYKPFMRPSGRGGGKMRPRKLRDLVHENLGQRIQGEGAHSSVEDARASMELFKVVKGKWEKELNEKKNKKMKGGKK